MIAQAELVNLRLQFFEALTSAVIQFKCLAHNLPHDGVNSFHFAIVLIEIAYWGHEADIALVLVVHKVLCAFLPVGFGCNRWQRPPEYPPTIACLGIDDPGFH